jgi:hypothetical protein
MLKVTTNAEQVSIRLRQLATGVGTSVRHAGYSAAAAAVGELTRRHLIRLGSWKHMSAERLGAQPTGILGAAAGKVSETATDQFGEVSIKSPAVRRAFHDVEIRPKSWMFLTIPASSISYGRRAAVLAGLGWKIYRPGKAKILMGKLGDDEPKLMYYLVSSVHQRQDRSLLPSDEAMKQSAAGAMLAFIRRTSK